jgi:hypothetical protein
VSHVVHRFAVCGLVLALAPPALACSCLPPSLTASWHYSSDTFLVRIRAERVRNGYQVYAAEVIQPFGGCTQPGDRIFVETPQSEAACGIDLVVGQEWLLTASAEDSRDRPRTYSVHLCGYNRPRRALTAEDKEFLASRPVTCPATGETTCADGSPPVSCLVDPCEVAPPCPEAATCEANYCLPCVAERYDAYWAPVCDD